jgi:two-component system, LytTR family, sensor kinase
VRERGAFDVKIGNSPLQSLVDSPTRMFWLLQTAGWTGFAGLHFLGGVGAGRPWTYIYASLSTAVLGIAITYGLRLAYGRLWHLPLRHLIPAAALALLSAAAAYGILYADIMHASCIECVRPATVLGYVWYVGAMFYVLLSWSGLYAGIKLLREFRRQGDDVVKARMMAHEAQLKMLRYQLNPHFLFNTLNSLSTLTLEGRSAAASDMIDNLSDFLRYSLESDPVQRVALAREIESLQQYLGIEQLRFSDRLTVRIDVDPNAVDALVPSMILQPLAENAIKHAVAKRAQGGTIELDIRCDRTSLDIRLRDNGPGDLPAESRNTESIGIGLANTRQRLRVLYGDRAQFTIEPLRPQGMEAHLRLPLETAHVAP